MPQITGQTATIVREQVQRIHCAVNDGTLDRETVNDALSKLHALLEAKPDSFLGFTGQVDAKTGVGTEPMNPPASPEPGDG